MYQIHFALLVPLEKHVDGHARHTMDTSARIMTLQVLASVLMA